MGEEWVNGTVGRVVDLNDESIEVELLSEPHKGTTVGVKRESWDRYQYKWNDKRRTIDIRTIGTYRQLPFILAWAVTIHKAQGLTLYDVNIDLGPRHIRARSGLRGAQSLSNNGWHIVQ